ncbi:MAG: DUF2093 domain-containing protein [Alphaproteobacteria bacterium]|nr:DUF2093 domain-containing protein [Alphaproteobacteria bacterium]
MARPATASGRLAKLDYLSGDYAVVEPGDHVLCAVTGAPIPLASLRYWSYERQEAYASAEIAARRHEELASAQGAS